MVSSKVPLKMIVSDLDFFIKESIKGTEEPIIRMKCRTEKEETICLNVKGFYPYFYIDDLSETKETIQSLLQHEDEFGNWIVEVDHIRKYSYYQHHPKYLYKISGRNPWKIRKFCELLDTKGIKCYENDIAYVSRFLIDTKIRGLNAIEVEDYEEIETDNLIKTYETHYSNITPEKEESDYHPTTLSFKVFIDASTTEEERKKAITKIVEEGEKRITALSITWGKGKNNIQSKSFILEKDEDKEEKKLLNKFWTEIHQIAPDVLVSFKGNAIDLPYLLKRMERYNIPTATCTPYFNGRVKNPSTFYGYRISGYMVYDISARSRWMRLKTGRKRLSSFVEEYLNEKREVTTQKINRLWINSIINNDEMSKKRLRDVINQDSQYIYDLFMELGFDEWLEVMRIVGIQPSKGIYSTARHLGEFALMRVLVHKDTLIPSYPSQEEKDRRKRNRVQAMGGYVMVPQGTLHEAVLIADFSSMYPSVMITHNIGGESFKGISYEYNKRFREKPDTGLKLMEKELLLQRKKIKKEIQELEIFLKTFPSTEKKENLEEKLKELKTKSSAIKVIANSMYGSHNYIGSRFFNTDISNAITHFSKAYIEKIAKWTIEYSNGTCKVVYGDTDSTFIKLSNSDDVFRTYKKVKQGEIFLLEDVPEVKELLSFFNNKLPEEMELEFVDLATRIVFAEETKKRYSYISAVTTKLEIIGFEAIRSDISEFAQEVQKTALYELLEYGNLTKAREAVIKKCIEFRNIKGTELLKLITVYGPVRKHPSEYKTKTPAIAALIDYSRKKNIPIEELLKEYNRFPYVILKGNSPLYKRSTHPSLLESTDKVDKIHYINQALRPVRRIGVNVKLKDIKLNRTTILDYTIEN